MLPSLTKDNALESSFLTGHDCAGEYWSWKDFLQHLLFILDNEIERDSVQWLEGGVEFIVQHTGEGKLAQRLGLRVCSLHQVLEALAFEYMEDNQCGYTIYHHHSFVLGHPSRIDEILALELSPSIERDIVMPNITYSSELKPLEIRLSLPDPLSKNWEVTIASSILSLTTLDAGEDFDTPETTGISPAKGTLIDDLDEGSDHDVNSPLWWSQHTDFSSICSDDLSDTDTLSQISAYYG
ncbi:hypothetical protein PHMEG_00018009 [Phytophthora megakarya]|uniref:Uncharacterized protein n=1 Tax=Phytophthora megakarya TaxID=4795 RepID=A0A225VV56_9STRA|nr:hypothetical protein PHMEG_00018009 [Phytophthora megakarya]